MKRMTEMLMISHQDEEPTRPSLYTTWTTRERVLLVCLLGYLALATSLVEQSRFCFRHIWGASAPWCIRRTVP
jgi:hypothetical protein